MSKLDYKVEKYASLLSTHDVKYLFKKLEEYFGSKNKAALNCNLTRKAVYDWEESKEQMKIETKAKVLETSLEYLTIETLDYLTSKIVESSREILISFLTSLYESLFKTDNKEETLKIVQKFQEIKTHYYGLLYNRYEYEIDDLTSKIYEHVQSKGLDWLPSTDYLFNIEKVKLIINKLLESTEKNDAIDELILLGFTYELAIEYKKKIQKIIENQTSLRDVTLFNMPIFFSSPASGTISQRIVSGEPESQSGNIVLLRKNPLLTREYQSIVNASANEQISG